MAVFAQLGTETQIVLVLIWDPSALALYIATSTIKFKPFYFQNKLCNHF